MRSSNGSGSVPRSPRDLARSSLEYEAARRLVILRNGWLNPAGVEDDVLLTRTMTTLYNAPPLWLAQAHARLDAAVLAAYGLSADISDDELLGHLLDRNLAQPSPADASIGEEAGEPASASLDSEPIGSAL